MDKIIDLDSIIMNIRKGSYQFIGSGSGRRVYDLGNGYVAKVAKNNRGIAQNQAEHHISSSDHSNIFAKTIKVSEDFRLLIMEKAVRIRDFSEVRDFFNVESNRELFQLEEIKSVFPNYNLLLNDLYRSSNWGMINNRPVIIDYGFTQSVRRRYYSPFRFKLM
ncbi:MAG TPA: hypothetical protein GX731_02535 [Clostridiales bacterium]|nr:hypothetical protein [Clostridiales bacterium]